MADPVPTRTFRDFIGSLPGGNSNSVLGDDLTMASLAAFAKTADLGALAGKDKVEIPDIDASGPANDGTYLRGDGTWQTPDGAGDMARSVYDPTNVNADAFDRANHHGDIPAENVSGLAEVATSGSYLDLTDTPPVGGDVIGPAGATAGNFPVLDATGKALSDSGKGVGDFATAAQGGLADTAVQPADIADMLIEDDIGVTVQAYDADTAKTDVAQAWTETQRGTIVPIAPSANLVADLDAGQEFRLSAGLNQNATFSLANADNHVGAKFSLTGYNDGTGGFTLSYGTGLISIGGTSPKAIPTGANKEWRIDGQVVAAGKYHFVTQGVGA